MTKLMTLLSGLAVLALLASCVAYLPASDKTPESEVKRVPPKSVFAFQEKPTTPYGTVIITRDINMVLVCNYLVTINGTPSAKMEDGERSVFYVPAGEVVIKVSRDYDSFCPSTMSPAEREIRLEAGETRKYRWSFSGQGFQLQKDD